MSKPKLHESITDYATNRLSREQVLKGLGGVLHLGDVLFLSSFTLFTRPKKPNLLELLQKQKIQKFSKNRYYLGTPIKSQLRGASYSVPCKQKDAAQMRRRGCRRKEQGRK